MRTNQSNDEICSAESALKLLAIELHMTEGEAVKRLSDVPFFDQARRLYKTSDIRSTAKKLLRE